MRTLDAARSRLSSPLKLRDYLSPSKTVAPRAKTIVFHFCVLDPDVTVSIHSAPEYVPAKPERDVFTIVTTAVGPSHEIADG